MLNGSEIIEKSLISIIVIAVSFIVYKFVTRRLTKEIEKRKISKKGMIILRKSLRYVFFITSLLLIILLWGGEVKSFWIIITSVLSIFAVAFFASWSYLSNIFAGFMLLGSKNLNIDEEIEIVGDNIKGKLKNISLLFCELEDKKGNVYQIPNNLMMTKVIKKIASK